MPELTPDEIKAELTEEERIDACDCSSGKSTVLDVDARIRIIQQNTMKKRAELYDLIAPRLALARRQLRECRAMLAEIKNHSIPVAVAVLDYGDQASMNYHRYNAIVALLKGE